MGVVYDAHDERRGHRVALKTLKQPSPETTYRLKREFRALADLSHPNIVQLYDLVVDHHGVSYSMEVVDGVDFVSYCRGDKLEKRLADASLEPTLPDRQGAARGDFGKDATDIDAKSHAAFDERRLRTALAQLCGALRALHGAGIVHRDVKPSNVLITREGRLVLLDFGLASDHASAEKESQQGIVGTAAYMAPEQADESETIGPAADWYAVGVMLFEVFSGQLPFTGSFLKMLLAKRQPAPRASTRVTGIPADLDDLCARLLATDPEARPSAPEIAALLGIADPDPGTARIELTVAPRFAGRQAELAALDRAWEAVRGGRPAVAWVRGPSGMGKSTLIAEYVSRLAARHRDAIILRGRCYEQELVPFKAIDGLIDGLSRVWRRLSPSAAAVILPRDGGSLQRLFPVLARVAVLADAPRTTEVRDPLEIRTRAIGALREVLQRLADRHPLVLFLDDLHWVDGDTLHLLEEVMRPPDAPRVLLLASSRSEGMSRALAQVLAAIDVDLTTIDLGPLAIDEARSLVATVFGEEHRELADRVVREAAGSPFFLGELIRYVQTVGENGTVSAASIEIGDVVRQRISLLPSTARSLLELIAVAGEPILLRELAAAAGSDAEQVARDIRVLRVDHLVRAPGGRGDERVEPYHDRIRAAILDLVDADGRRRSHRALALALGGDASPARLARHWAGAGDDVRAAIHARRAADRAVSAFDFESAAELYRMALELGAHDEAAQREVRVRLGDALVNCGRSAEAAETFLAAVDTTDSLHRLELRRRAAEQLLNAGFIERGVETLRTVLAEIGEDLPASSGATVRRFLWHYLRLRLKRLRFTPRDASEIPPRDLLRLDCYITIGLCLGVIDPILGALYQAKGFGVALALGEPSRIVKNAAIHAGFLYSQNSSSRADAVTALCERLATASGNAEDRAWVATLRGFAAYFGGDFDAGAGRFAEAQRVFQEETTGTIAEQNKTRVFRCQCLRFQHRFAELADVFEDARRDARQRGDQYMTTTLHRAFAVRFLADDDLEGAREALAAAAWAPPEHGYHLQHWYELRASAEIALYVGEGDDDALRMNMNSLTSSRMLRVRTVRTEAAWFRMRLALAGRTRAWNAAKEVAALRKERAPFATVWAGLGAAALAQGEARADQLRETAALADRAQLAGCAHAARWRLGETVGGSEGDDLVAAARAALRDLGAARPERMLEVIAPMNRASATGVR